MDMLKKIGVEKIVAATAAIITGAAVYLMPQGVLEEAVAASGMASALPPLEPPLGAKARIGLALFAAGTAFGFIVMLLGLVGRFGGKPAAKPAAGRDDVPAAPRVRRRDQHPDAPARAPLLIEREIGLPEEDAAVVQEPPRRLRSGWRSGPLPAEPVMVAPVMVAPIMAPIVAATEEPEAVAEPPVFLPEPEPEPEAVPVQADVWAEPEVDDEPAARPRASVSHPSWLDVSAPQPVTGSQPPLVELVERLERALAARGAGRVSTQTSERRDEQRDHAPARAEADEDGTDARLRSALESLKRFAPQRG